MLTYSIPYYATVTSPWFPTKNQAFPSHIQVQPSNCASVNLVCVPLKESGVTSKASEPLFVKILYSPIVVPSPNDTAKVERL